MSSRTKQQVEREKKREIETRICSLHITDQHSLLVVPQVDVPPLVVVALVVVLEQIEEVELFQEEEKVQ